MDRGDGGGGTDASKPGAGDRHYRASGWARSEIIVIARWCITSSVHMCPEGRLASVAQPNLGFERFVRLQGHRPIFGVCGARDLAQPHQVAGTVPIGPRIAALKNPCQERTIDDRLTAPALVR